MLKSTKIAIGFGIVAAASYFGYRAIGGLMIDGFKPTPIKPGRVNLLGVDAGGRYRIVVQNQIAVLQEAGDDFEAPENRDAESYDDGGQKRRVPIKEMLLALQGDEKALGRFVMIMNDIKEASLPPVRVYWDAADVRKALEGDEALAAKLQKDLGVGFDGRPLPQLQLSSLENGIVLRKPVRLQVPIEGKPQEMTGIVLEPYRPRFATAVEAAYADKQVTRDQIRGYVVDEARKLEEDPRLLEDVKRSLLARTDEDSTRGLAAGPERILRNATVILNDAHIDGARLREYKDPDNKPMYDLLLDLTDEGRKRVWKYTRDRVGSQIMLVVDGVAIAAPRVTHELAQREATITQLQDGVLARGAIEAIEETKRGKE